MKLTNEGKGEIETYQCWLERQLTSRRKKIKEQDLEIAHLKSERQVFKQLVQDSNKKLLNALGFDDEPQEWDRLKSAFNDD